MTPSSAIDANPTSRTWVSRRISPSPVDETAARDVIDPCASECRNLAGSVRRVGIAALASGTGTILEALIADRLPIDVVVVDRPCRAVKVAEHAGIPVVSVVRVDFSPSFDREGYTEQVVAALDPFVPELIAMAGFGTMLSAAIHTAYPGRILNTHPALLPAFKGWHAVRDALDAHVEVTGCTVHVATLEVDEGPILAQAEVPVLPGDDEAALGERIKQTERQLYPATIRTVLARIARGESLI